MNNKDFSKKVVISLGIFFVVFVSIMIATYWIMGSIPDVLVQCVLGAGGIEAFALAWIKRARVKNGDETSDDGYVVSDIIDE